MSDRGDFTDAAVALSRRRYDGLSRAGVGLAARVALAVLGLVLAACGGGSAKPGGQDSPTGPGSTTGPGVTATTTVTPPPGLVGIHKIRHVVVIMQENR